MSRAFVKEPDGDLVADDQPEWTISSHTNYVTANGLQQLRDEQDNLLKKIQELKQDSNKDLSNKIELERFERALRYYESRINSAQLITKQDPNVVGIGATVRMIDEDNKEYEFMIVGEDEADIKHGKISWVSPLAKALLGREVDDEVIWPRPAGDLRVEIVEIVYRQ
jgi:transcription elongation GreA/GreB family factor